MPLAEGLIGDSNAAMLGSLILGQVWDSGSVPGGHIDTGTEAVLRAH